jgi:L-serine dehydratase
MTISVFDLFSIGIGPSSSHTVGPMRAAHRFVEALREDGTLTTVDKVQAHLYGSLAATGHGHGTITAIVLGLEGEQPHLVDPSKAAACVEAVRSTGSVNLGGEHEIAFELSRDVVLHLGIRLDFHSNGMRFVATAKGGAVIASREYFSIGGGFVLDESETHADYVGPRETVAAPAVPFPFRSADELMALCAHNGLSISSIMMENEKASRSEAEVRDGLLHLWDVMQSCISRGSIAEGILPGGLNVRRRAAIQRAQLEAADDQIDPLRAMEWVTLFALAVNEENAAGGRVVTAPTNGAAGIIPAVLSYYVKFVPGANDDGVVRFLLAAGAIGSLFKENASISGAEVGCQGEVGSACSMAAGALAEVLGGTPEQVENAAEIGIEHNLGLTCDPVGGLVQIPCIERNAIASVKAITAARMAVRGDGAHYVSLDTAIDTMRETGADMSHKYKETALGGLALRLNMVEC